VTAHESERAARACRLTYIALLRPRTPDGWTGWPLSRFCQRPQRVGSKPGRGPCYNAIRTPMLL